MAVPLDPNLLGLTALVTVGYQFMFFLIAATFEIDTVTDLAGGTNFVVLAAMGLGVSEATSARQVVCSSMVIVWGLRLSGFLLMRILQWGEDKRFDDKRSNLLAFAAFWVIQAIWVWSVSLPVTLLNGDSGGGADAPFGTASDVVGVVMWSLGLLVEVLADQQKLSYKADPAHSGHWCDVGVWAWSRHPNYFGEILLWWGVFTTTASGFVSGGDAGVWVGAILGPLLLTLLLLFVSGIPLLEDSADKRYGARADYLEYKRVTSPLVPLPPSIYAALPGVVKGAVLCEWAMYSRSLPPPSAGSDDSAHDGDQGDGLYAAPDIGSESHAPPVEDP